MDYGETFLHHYFSADRIGGEWFDSMMHFWPLAFEPLLDNLQVEMEEYGPLVRRWQELNDVPSNTLMTRPPTVAETQWANDFTTAYEELTVAKAILDTHKNNLSLVSAPKKPLKTSCIFNSDQQESCFIQVGV